MLAVGAQDERWRVAAERDPDVEPAVGGGRDVGEHDGGELRRASLSIASLRRRSAALGAPSSIAAVRSE